MRTLLLALCIVCPLSACQDTTRAQGPPPKFSPSTQALFEQYMEEINPTLFVVSTDGRAAWYTYCPAHADFCYPASGATKSTALRDCEKDSGGVPCRVYAVGRRIVWGGAPAPSSQHLSYPDDNICRLSVSKNGSPRWDDGTARRKFVDEANRRGLSPEQCYELLGWKTY